MKIVSFLIAARFTLVSSKLEASQHAALMELYDALGSKQTPVYSQLLENKQLTGTIPSSVGQLSSLQYLYLENNHLTGTIPSTVGQLSSLTVLNLFGSQLIGTIPSTVGQLPFLRFCNFQSTYLDCATAPSHCTCSTATAPVTSASASAVGMTTAIETAAVTTMTVSTATTADATNSTTTLAAFTPTNFLNTTTLPITSISPATDNTALIAGIVGGSIAALLLLAVIIFLVMRSRKSKSVPADTALVAQQPYGALPSPCQPDYDDTSAVRAKPARGEYDAPDAPLRF